MKIPDNSLNSFISFFRESLLHVFEKEELEANLYEVFRHSFGLSRAAIVLEKNKTFSESEVLTLFRIVKSLKSGKPLAYILQVKEFYGLVLKVNENVLIPRPETEELVDWVLKNFKRDQRIKILDVGSGSGCIALALKKHLPNSEITAVDFSREALHLAEENALKLKLHIRFCFLDFLNQELEGEFDIIVSNPPYIAEAERKEIHSNVLDHEPHMALFAKEDPLIFYRRMLEYSAKHLNRNGYLYWEINQYYSKQLMQLLAENNFREIELRKDINNNPRMIKAKNAK